MNIPEWLVETLAALVIAAMLLLGTIIIFSAAAAAESSTLTLTARDIPPTKTIVCFYALEEDSENPEELCYYYTKENISVPDYPHRAVIHIWTGKETLSDVIRILQTLSGKEKITCSGS